MRAILESRDELLRSAVTLRGIHSEAEVLAWLALRADAHRYSVQQIPLEGMRNWAVDPVTGDITHSSGKFFSITGLQVEITGPTPRRWSQPILVQREVGILGFIGKRVGSVLHLLVQAKMEPGNINLVQLSPTLQATRSNFSQVHGGRRPPFMEYFVEPGRGITLVDQLQSEQGSKYLRKRNRNVIVQIADDELPAVPEDFLWVTLGQLHQLAQHPNLLHLDCRSILGGLSFRHCDGDLDREAKTSFASSARDSLSCPDDKAENTLAVVLGWLAKAKIETELATKLVPLRAVQGWHLRNGVIEHELGRFFRVVGVDVHAASREVPSWRQPLIASVEGGVIGLIAQQRQGVVHFLIQARVEPGLIDAIELAPTVQYAPANYGPPLTTEFPPYTEFFDRALPEQLRLDTVLSDEGGRFYHARARHVVIEIASTDHVAVRPSHCWMTLAQLHECARFSSVLNIELRSILSCISLA